MFSSEWSLVLFTVLTQAAVGIVVISEFTRLLLKNSGAHLKWQAPAACALTALGLLFSLTHLGTPLHSVFTILNLGSSWLSREILVVGCFFAVILLLVLQRRKAPEKGATPLAIASIVVGLGAVFVMTRVYLLPTVPVWNSIATTFGFFGTMLLSGSVACGLIGSLENRSAKNAESCSSMAGVFCVSALVGLALKFIGIVLSMIALNNTDNYGMNALHMVADKGVDGLVAWIVMVCAGIGLFSWFALKAMGTKQIKLIASPALCALALVLAGEIIGRLMFYGTYMRIGI